MMPKGKRIYAPPAVIQEAENIMKQDGIEKQAEALKKMVDYCQWGRKFKNGGPKWHL